MAKRVLNLNIGVLGHVDSGKTSLAKALSTIASTASFDKNPQSRERGITIDLGFSSLQVDIPEHLRSYPYDNLQFTLVDCPGHASLIRTIIGGSQIIDMIILVIDVTKGMQTQTAECLIIGEITCQKMIVVLNKIDLLPEEKKTVMIEKMSKKMRLTLKKSVFQDSHIVSISARPGGPDAIDVVPSGIENLIDVMRQNAFIPERHISQPFLFAVDHCFGIRGQGTVITGTILQGTVKVNDTVEIPSLHVTKKIKSMQMFKQPIDQAVQGDRLGICVKQFDPKQLERGIVCAPGYVPTIMAAIIDVQKIKHFKLNVKTKAKFHISIGHETIMAKLTVFGSVESSKEEGDCFDFSKEYKYQDELLLETEQEDKDPVHVPEKQYALIEFEKSIQAAPKSLVIGSKLDIDIYTSSCRLAFWGHLIEAIQDKNYISTILPKLRIFKEKFRKGIVDRAPNLYSVIGKNMFKKETNLQLFVGFQVQLSSGEKGIIAGSFGQSGKFKVDIPEGLKESTYTQLTGSSKKKGKQSNTEDADSIVITLEFVRFIFDPEKKMIQRS